MLFHPQLDLHAPRIFTPPVLRGEQRRGNFPEPLLRRQGLVSEADTPPRGRSEGFTSSSQPSGTPRRPGWLGSRNQDLVYLHAQKLDDREAEWRRRAAERLAALAESSRSAAAGVAEHSSRLIRCCRDRNEDVRTAALSALEAVVQAGEGMAVTSFIPQIADSLDDGSSIVCRRAASLCGAIADAGFAVFIAYHAEKLVRCVELGDSIRVTPLRALASLATGGEARVVLECGMQAIWKCFSDKLRAVRIAALDAFTAVARGGVEDRLQHWCRSQAPGATGESFDNVLNKISKLFFDDKDIKSRLAAAGVLRALADLYREETQAYWDQHRDRFASAAEDMFGEEGWQLQELIAMLLRASQRRPQAWAPGSRRSMEEADEGTDSEEECSEAGQECRLECSICRRSLARHGAAKALPCGHTFHEHCVDRWLQGPGVRTRACPLCRRRPSSARLAPLHWQAVSPARSQLSS
eukprot:TRINITY_DN10786_c0_g1_i1.p1 TRINITY_DN10786_c0_g1~~TRINITY_DN10786_c0_g1_i1.p1  ORF type:complete len:489 (+),score=94.16 TRINITY_DN10786_c0_g1_i1:68-1468(+)